MGINHFGIMSYSIFSTLAYGSAGIIFYLEAKRRKIESEPLIYIVFAALLGGLIGSRIGSALFVYREFYFKNPLALLSPEVGGKTIVGGLIGGYIGVIIAKKILKVNRSTGDLFAPGLALGIAIGRVGCFLNGCCYGAISHLPWSVMIKGELRHPTQLYESLFCFGLFIFLWLIRKRVDKEGDLFKIFLFIYSFFRFWIEFLRADKVMIAFNLSIAQIVCVFVFCYLAVYFLKQNKESIHGKEDL
jgi:phosphatidylglycerol:prolipoprotein diacylglycerol transferase